MTTRQLTPRRQAPKAPAGAALELPEAGATTFYVALALMVGFVGVSTVIAVAALVSVVLL